MSGDSSPNHIIDDADFNNLVGLLKILAHQLELSLLEAHKDYDLITQFCLLAEEGQQHRDAGIDKSSVVGALQYYDRKRQRIQSVRQSIEAVAQNFEEEKWSAIYVDLERELAKTDSFYTECQVKEMSALANLPIQPGQRREKMNDLKKDHDDDLEMF